MSCKNCKKVKIAKSLSNAENVNRLNNDFVATQDSCVVTVDDGDEQSQFSIIPIEESETTSVASTSCPLQIQNVMSLFDMPADCEVFIDDDFVNLRLDEFDASES